MHCTLETLPGLGFLQSCCGGDEATQSSSGCQEDPCGEVESGLYKIEDNPTLASSFAVLITLAAWDCLTELPTGPVPHFLLRHGGNLFYNLQRV